MSRHMKIRFSKITVFFFALNLVLALLLNSISYWKYINLYDPSWINAMVIFSLLGIYCSSDLLSVVTPAILFVSGALAFRYDETQMRGLRGGLIMILMVFEAFKLLLFLGYSGGFDLKF